MTHEEIKAKYDRLVDYVRRMRGWQKEYFRYRSSEAKSKAMALERQVDQIIDQEVKIQKSKQADLF